MVDLSFCMLEVHLQLAIHLHAGGLSAASYPSAASYRVEEVLSRRVITQHAGFQILLLLILGMWIESVDGRVEVCL